MDFNTRYPGLTPTLAAFSRGICRGIGSELGQKQRLDTPQEFYLSPLHAVQSASLFRSSFQAILCYERLNQIFTCYYFDWSVLERTNKQTNNNKKTTLGASILKQEKQKVKKKKKKASKKKKANKHINKQTKRQQPPPQQTPLNK